MITEAMDKYLKAIYRLLEEHERVSTSLLAETLSVKPASVTNMVQKLAHYDPPLLEYESHRGVSFTEEGKKLALRILRHHRLLELYLHDLLDYSWDKVHDEADRMDHVISIEFADKIAGLLGDPQYDCHGDPIPSRELVMPSRDLTSLQEIGTGKDCIVRRVRSQDPDVFKYLGEKGIVPGVEVKILNREPFEGPLTMLVHKGDHPIEISLGYPVSGSVLVEEI